MDAIWVNLFQPAFWVAAGQIVGINIILSGDNAVVIALACRMLPSNQRMWGMILGAGAAVILRVVFTLVVAQAMEYEFLKLVGGVLLLWVAVKLVVPDADGVVRPQRARRCPHLVPGQRPPVGQGHLALRADGAGRCDGRGQRSARRAAPGR